MDVRPRSILLWMAAVVALAAACAPLLVPGFVGGHEGPAYLFRAAEFAGQLSEGEVRPRWCPDFYWGYGYPFFVYYPPALFYAASLAMAAGLSAGPALEVVTALGWGLLFFGVRRLCTCWAGPQASTVGAIAAVVATYRLSQIHVRGDLAEALGTALLPWLLAEFVLLARPDPPSGTPSRGVLAARGALLLGAVFYVHTLTAVAACFSVGAVGLWAMIGGHGARAGLRGTLRAAGAGGLGVLLGASYWIPAWFGQGVVRTDQMLDRGPGGFSWWYGDHFVRWWQRFDPSIGFGDSLPGPVDTMSFGSSPVLWLGLAVATFFMVREREFARRALGPMLAVGAANFLLLDPAEPLWNVAPLLPWFQFPWRLLLVEGLAAAVVLALVVDRLGSMRPTAAAPLIVALALLAAAAPSLIACWTHARANALVLMPDQRLAVEHPRRLQTVGIHDPRGIWYAVTTAARNEYLPRTVLAPPTAHPDAAGRVRPPADLGPPVEQLGAWRRWSPNIPRAGTYEVAWFDFPGLRATLDGKPLDILDTDPQGLVRFDLPPGRHLVDVWYERPPQQPVASGVTAGGLLVVLILLRRARLRQPSDR